MDAAIISRHLPIITARIQFSQSSPAILPITTPRISFAHINGLHTISSASHHVATPGEMDVDSQSSRGSSDAEIEGISNPSQDLIQKPPGEAGRPGSGGFNLESSLGWPRGVFDKITVSYVFSLSMNSSSAHAMQKFTHLQASKQIDTSQSYNKHKKEKINKICQLVSSHALAFQATSDIA
jgi:hypothetical protein